MSFALITSYYNPERYRSRRENFDAFAAGLEDAGVRWYAAEASLGGEGFELPGDPNIIRLEGGDVLWQKERILNVLLGRLPPNVKFVAWADCDLLFENREFAFDAERILHDEAVVQLFERVIRLPRGHRQYRGEGESWESMAFVHKRSAHELLSGDFARHGHTGFGWAARRSVLQGVGLYDACIAGSGDHMMAHAFYGDWHSRCMDRILCQNPFHVRHFVSWCRKIYPRVRSRVGFVPGSILHLWHGETADRRYVLRNRELAGFEFDPLRDVRIGSSGLWEWTGRKSGLPQWAKTYFKHRREDA